MSRLLGGLARGSQVVQWPTKAPSVLKHSNDKWRSHPSLQADWKSLLPGIQYGAPAAVVYELAMFAFGGDDHGHHDAGHGKAAGETHYGEGKQADKKHDKH